jgi:hypothetical protein
MASYADLREYVEMIEAMIFEYGLKGSKDKKIVNVFLHLRTAKDILNFEQPPTVVNLWYVRLQKDYDHLCHFVADRKVKKPEKPKVIADKPVVSIPDEPRVIYASMNIGDEIIMVTGIDSGHKRKVTMKCVAIEKIDE